MREAKTKLMRAQLAEQLNDLRSLQNISRPAKGWVRAVREAEGMSGRQLAKRLGVTPPRITEMEKAELSGKVNLQTLRRAAEALDCDLVLGFVPKTSLENTIRRQALRAASKKLGGIGHTMLLEEQALDPEEQTKMIKAKAEEWERSLPRWLWDVE